MYYKIISGFMFGLIVAAVTTEIGSIRPSYEWTWFKAIQGIIIFGVFWCAGYLSAKETQ